MNALHIKSRTNAFGTNPKPFFHYEIRPFQCSQYKTENGIYGYCMAFLGWVWPLAHTTYCMCVTFCGLLFFI